MSSHVPFTLRSEVYHVIPNIKMDREPFFRQGACIRDSGFWLERRLVCTELSERRGNGVAHVETDGQ